MEISAFNPATAPDDELRAAHRLVTKIRTERYPHEPALTFDQYVSNLTSVPPIFAAAFWRVWNETNDEMVGQLAVVTTNTEENAHMAQLDLAVAPERRREGIGTRLLAEAAHHARAKGKRLILFDTASTVPAGDAFARAIGATVGLEGHVNELQLAEVDRPLMRSWMSRAQERAAGFELGWWLDGYPEDRLEEVATLLQMFNSQPMGDLEVEDFDYTADWARQIDERNRKRGITRWTCYAFEREGSTVAGFTELFITRSTPEKLGQGLTAVLPQYRNRGLGRWLKAAMVDKVLAELPEAKVISTGNADSNEPMLHINEEMGFRPALSETIWQAPIETVEAYLKGRGVIQPVHVGDSEQLS